MVVGPVDTLISLLFLYQKKSTKHNVETMHKQQYVPIGLGIMYRASLRQFCKVPKSARHWLPG